MQLFLKKNHWHRCFPVSFAKFVRTTFFTEYLRWLLLYILMKILWLQYRHLRRSFSNTFITAWCHRPYTQVLLLTAVSVCVKFQRRFFLRVHWKRLPVQKQQTRETLSKMWNLFQLTIRILLTLFWCLCYQLWTDFASFCCVFIVDFGQGKLSPAGIYCIKLTM